MFIVTGCSASQGNVLAHISITLTQMYGACSQLIRSGSSKCGQSYLYVLVCVFKDIPIDIKVSFSGSTKCFYESK